ncbi:MULTISPECIES: hypothetical protein [Actinomyces]|uniref:Uncharacterized protein n=1 Tax=Actinomyces respiraculi TaxID=2744574 RepID=A0A7T0LMV4_9ACTO|nr:MULTISPECIES: hypothetical protein [Actinomyces]QPL06033.1 hypothetical protein ID810_03560 [Actinomyces respiraculi]
MKKLRMFQDMPTVMDASAELAAMRALRAMPMEHLTKHREEFVDIVRRLDDSHADSSGGAFGLTPDNEAEFHEFADWLRGLGSLMGWPSDTTWALDVTFEQMTAAYPQVLEDAAAGPRPGSPMVVQLAERVQEVGPLEIGEAVSASEGLRLSGEEWVFITAPGWRVLNSDGTLAYAWSTPGVGERVDDLVDLSVQEVTSQSAITNCDPVLHLSDGRCVEAFSGDPFRPWSMRIAAGTFTGAPTAPEWL